MSIPTNPYINALLIVAAFWVGSYVVTFLMGRLEILSKLTRTDLDDKLIHAAKLPVRYLLIITGFYVASRYLDISWEWKGVGIDTAFLALIFMVIGFAASRIIKAWIRWYAEHENIHRNKQTMFIFLRRIISVVIYSVALLLILDQFGIEIGPLLAGMGVAGIVIALGLQEPMSNLFSALFLVMDKSVNVGDWIQLEDGTKAYIEDFSWRSVTIRTKQGNTVIVPNAQFVGQKIASYDYPESAFEISVPVGVAYGSDLALVERTALAVTERVMEDEGLEKSDGPPKNPRVRFREFGDSAINFIIRLRVDRAIDEGRVKHKIIKGITEDFRKEGITIPFPQRDVHLYKE